MYTSQEVLMGLDDVRGFLQWKMDCGWEAERETVKDMLAEVTKARVYLKMLDIPQQMTLEQVNRANVVWMLQWGKLRAEPMRILFVNADALLAVSMGVSQVDMLKASDYGRTWTCWNKEPREDQVAGVTWRVDDEDRDSAGGGGGAGDERGVGA